LPALLATPPMSIAALMVDCRKISEERLPQDDWDRFSRWWCANNAAFRKLHLVVGDPLRMGFPHSAHNWLTLLGSCHSLTSLKLVLHAEPESRISYVFIMDVLQQHPCLTHLELVCEMAEDFIESLAHQLLNLMCLRYFVWNGTGWPHSTIALLALHPTLQSIQGLCCLDPMHRPPRMWSVSGCACVTQVVCQALSLQMLRHRRIIDGFAVLWTMRSKRRAEAGLLSGVPRDVLRYVLWPALRRTRVDPRWID